MIVDDGDETGETAFGPEAMVTDDNVGPSIDPNPALVDRKFWEHDEDYADLYREDDEQMEDSLPPNPEQDAVMDDGEVPDKGDDEEMKEESEEVDQEMVEPGIQSSQGDFQQAWNASNQTQPATLAPVPTAEERRNDGLEESLEKQMEGLTVESEPQDPEYALVVANLRQPAAQALAPVAQETSYTNGNIRPPWLQQTTTTAYTVITGTHTLKIPNMPSAPADASTLVAPQITPAPAAIPASAAPPFVPQAPAPPYYPPTPPGSMLAPPYIPPTSISPCTHPAPYCPIYSSGTATTMSFSNPSASIGPRATLASLTSLRGPSPTTHSAPPGPFASSSHSQQPAQPVNIPGLMFSAQPSLTAAVPYGQTTAPAQTPSSPSSSESSAHSPPPPPPQLLPSAPIGQPGQRPMRSIRAQRTDQAAAPAPPPQSLLSTERVQLPGLPTQYATPESREASEAQPSPSPAKSSSTEPPYSPFSPSTPQGEFTAPRSSSSNLSSPIKSPPSSPTPGQSSSHEQRVILPLRRRKTKEILARLPPPPPPLFVAPPPQSTGADPEATDPPSPTYQQPPSTPPHVSGPNDLSFSLQVSDGPSVGASRTSEKAEESPATPPISPPLSDLSPGPPLPDDSRTKKRNHSET